ncbi:MAG: nuclear transport factor 2 family protein [Robiginitomaculum sp.]
MTINTALLAAIGTYFDAIYFCDAGKLDQVFHKTSNLFDVDEGNIFTDPIASFRQGVATRPSPASAGQKREEEIIMIDWLSKDAATVKIRLLAHKNVFVDHLCFVHGGEGSNKKWKIVSKVWHLESVRD